MPELPQGLSEEQFEALSARVRSAADHYGEDIQIQGSRVAGTAESDSDLDIAIRVPRDRFEEKLVDVKITCCGWILHRERNGDQFVGNAVGAEMFALIVGVQ